MSFVTNPVQQMTIDDSTFYLTDRERKALDRSWAKPFAEDIFPMIDDLRNSLCPVRTTMGR